jgi:methyltransferase (TIGR00027 family)
MPRTHDDSWDLASSVGATATMVATSRAMASRGPEPLLDDPFAEPLVRAVGLAPFVRILDGDLSLEDDPMLNRKTRTEQMAVRTRFFDDFFTGAAAAGVRQAVILASGLDTRSYRLPWGDGVVVYEIDQPQVIEFKTRTLADLGAKPTAELRTVAIDLRDDWPSALRAKGFDVNQPTAWSAEGLLPYLPADAQDRLFTLITELSAPGSRIAVETAASHADERRQEMRDRFERVAAELGIERSVDIQDLIYHDEDRAVVVDWLNNHGWRATAQNSGDEMRRLDRWVDGVPMGDDKDAFAQFVTAERA